MHASSGDEPRDLAQTVFAGLVPRESPAVRAGGVDTHGRFAKSMFTTVPILLVGSMAAMTLNLTGPVEPANAKPAKPRGSATETGRTLRAAAQPTTVATAGTGAAPSTYRVAAGDTVSDIAGRFGLSTASVLALNGLSWSSLIFPGQELKLSNGAIPVVEQPPAAPSQSGRYTIVAGDTISAIADRFGISTLSVLTANGLGWSSIIYPGQTIASPSLIGPGTPVDDPAAAASAPAAQEQGTPAGAAAPATDTAPPAASVAPPAAEAAPPAPAASPPVTTGTSYTIVAGDTLSGIAAKFGISTQQLLDANGLDWSSVIFSGHSLTIPATAPAASGGEVALLNDDMRANASVIIQVGRELGVPDYGIVIALAAAMQESSMRNIPWGDRDSVGLFQQRPSAGWGSVDQLTTPSYAARLFYGGPGNPNAGNTRGLLDIAGWQGMSVTQAAQRVQISAYPDAYAKWEASARAWLAQLG